ncbi:hypothetical protein BTA51_24625 [Hahella sp. CCB-MM4]|nr:hypothetical protein BTA51_24625 [Hahella sp. CCB-MM4]
MGSLKLRDSVGKDGKNASIDVKLIKALINVYSRISKEDTFTVEEKCDEKLIKAINNFQKSIADNSLADFKTQLKSKTNWPAVPKDRFNRRNTYLEKAK